MLATGGMLPFSACLASPREYEQLHRQWSLLLTPGHAGLGSGDRSQMSRSQERRALSKHTSICGAAINVPPAPAGSCAGP